MWALYLGRRNEFVRRGKAVDACGHCETAACLGFSSWIAISDAI